MYSVVCTVIGEYLINQTKDILAIPIWSMIELFLYLWNRWEVYLKLKYKPKTLYHDISIMLYIVFLRVEYFISDRPGNERLGFYTVIQISNLSPAISIHIHNFIFMDDSTMLVYHLHLVMYKYFMISVLSLVIMPY